MKYYYHLAQLRFGLFFQTLNHISFWLAFTDWGTRIWSLTSNSRLSNNIIMWRGSFMLKVFIFLFCTTWYHTHRHSQQSISVATNKLMDAMSCATQFIANFARVFTATPSTTCMSPLWKVIASQPDVTLLQTLLQASQQPHQSSLIYITPWCTTWGYIQKMNQQRIPLLFCAS